MKRRLLKALKWISLASISALLALLIFLVIEHRTEVTLPAPTGPFAVGRAIYDWKDDAAPDPASSPQGKREVLAWIWYPAAGHSSETTDYLPAGIHPPAAPTTLFGLLTRNRVRAHAVDGAAVSSQQNSYPLLIMRGGASAPVINYSSLAEDLASHGYVVVGIDAPYRTGRIVFPDGRVVFRSRENNPELATGAEFSRPGERLLSAWIADMRFVLDRLAEINGHDPSGKFTGRLDLTRVGAFGHSFGGAQAAQFCHDDARCKAGVDIDGSPVGSVIQDGLHQPFMFLLSDHGDTQSDPESRKIVSDIHSIYDRLPADKRIWAVISGAFHFTFSDDGALLKSRLIRGVLKVLGKLRISGSRQLEVTTYSLRTFFDGALKGSHAVAPDLRSPSYPELRVLQ